MRMSVSEAAKLTGVSVRTLHYYDEIGLLVPTETAENGYRYYGNEALERLQQILFYRELDFSLTEIKRILSLPDYDRELALKSQKELLLMKRERLEGLISLVELSLRGERDMSFTQFDRKEIEDAKKKYSMEVQERWGESDAYRESVKRTDRYGKEEWGKIQTEMEEIFCGFSKCEKEGNEPASQPAQTLVKRWKDHISRYYYECTDEILAGLGEMYTADLRFAENMNRFGEGTAAFMSKAIKSY